MASRKRELENAVSALKEVKKEDVFRRVGELMIKVKDTKGLATEMTEELDTLIVRVTSIEGQEKTLREMYEKLGKELNEALKGYR
jgi:chaperonin cofactor prefoldin